MPVDSTHRQYDAHRDMWARCRDAAAGGDAVKAAGTKYLPKLSGMDEEGGFGEYDAYRKRALWYGATGRTIQGLAGAVFRKAPVFTLPDAFEEWLADITLTGLPLDVFAQGLFDEILTTGRVAAYVEMPPLLEGSDPGEARRPYLVMVPAERVLNWSTTAVSGRAVLTRAVIYEEVETPGDDEWEAKTVDQWRVLELVDGVYTQRVFRKSEAGTTTDASQKFVQTEEITPRRRGETLDYIPLCVFGPNNLTPDVEKPPLIDLVDVNLSHYRTSADLEHGRHYCGLPTPWVAGFPRDTKLRIGSNIAWVSDDPAAKVGLLEFAGQGLGALEKALVEKAQQMAVLGARLLEEQKRAAEAADTVRLRQSGEQATLQAMIATCSMGLQQLLSWQVEWAGGDAEGVEAQLNTDVIGDRASPQELKALTEIWQAGGMAWETYYELLQHAELTRPGVSAEDERTQIEQEEGGELAARRGELNPGDQLEIQRRVAAAAGE